MDLPYYQCHKKVRAAKIKHIVLRAEDGSGMLYFMDPQLKPVEVSRAYMDKHNPKIGGYYVQYKDGYESWSPAEAFEDGYSLADEPW